MDDIQEFSLSSDSGSESDVHVPPPVVPKRPAEDEDDVSDDDGWSLANDGYKLSLRGASLIKDAAIVMQEPFSEALNRRTTYRFPVRPSDALDKKDDEVSMGLQSIPMLRGCSAVETLDVDAWRYMLEYLNLRDLMVLRLCSSTMARLVDHLVCVWRQYYAPASSPLAWSPEQMWVHRHVVERRRSLFLTGPAGAGKTILMRWLIRFVAAHTSMIYRCAAPTGIVSVPLDGQTLHSLLCLGGTSILCPPGQTRQRGQAKPKSIADLTSLDVLFVEEPGMMSSAMLRHLDETLRASKKASLEPFGGIPVVFCGDFSQLPPIENRSAMLSPDSSSSSSNYRAYAFKCPVWQEVFGGGKNTVVLNRTFRQDNQEYISLLNRVRLGKMTIADDRALRSRIPLALRNVDPPSRERLNTEYAKLPRENRPKRADFDRQRYEQYTRTLLTNVPDTSAIVTGRRDTKKRVDKIYLENLPGAHPTEWTCAQTGTKTKGITLCKHLRLKDTAKVMLTNNSVLWAAHSNLPYKIKGKVVELANGSRGVVAEIVRKYQRAAELLEYGKPVIIARGSHFSDYSVQKIGVDGFRAFFRSTEYIPEGGAIGLEMHRKHGVDPPLHWTVDNLVLVAFQGHEDTPMLVLPTDMRVMRQYTWHGEGNDAGTGLGARQRRRRGQNRTKMVMVCQGGRVQFPLCLARAFTSHKSQGATLRDGAAVMLNECFEVGQPYVMLSRVPNLGSLIVLNNRFSAKQIESRASLEACQYQDSLLASDTLAAVFDKDGPVINCD